MYIVLPEAKNLTILDYFIEFLSKLFTNFDLMKARWNPPTPIDNLFQQFNNGK